MTTDRPDGSSARRAKREYALADTFVLLADTLVDDYDIVDFLQSLVDATVQLLGASAAGLLLADQRGGLAVAASSSEDIRLLEVFQLQHDEGPCLDCVRTGVSVTAGDLDRESARWPQFVPAATRSGFRSVVAVPLRLRTEIVGGLNLFYPDSQPLPAEDQRIAQALADVATIGILQHRFSHRSLLLAEQLQHALNSRVAIEQAKGMLAERRGMSLDSAFDMIRQHARNHNMKLTDAAYAVIQGELSLGS